MARKKNRTARRAVALQNLKNAKFFEKNDRKQETWEKRVKQEIATLEDRLKYT